MTTAAPPRANGHVRPVTLRLPEHGPVSGWPRQDDPGQSRTAAGEPGRRWRDVDGDTVIRVLAAVVVLAVAAFAAIVSYSHIFDLGVRHGQDGTAARLLPLSVDGLIAAASLVMVHAVRRKLPVPRLARAMLVTGVTATVAANVLYGLPPAWVSPVVSALIGAVVSAWPAVAFVGSVEMAVQFVRDARTAATAPPGDAPGGVPDDTAQDDTDDDKKSDMPLPEPPRRRTSGRDKALRVMARHPGMSDAEVANRAGVSVRTVQRAKGGGADG